MNFPFGGVTTITDYATSADLYQLFSPAYLQTQVQIGLPSTITAAQIQAEISRVVRPLNFGNVTHVPHTAVDGLVNGQYAGTTSNLTAQTPLRGFSLGVPPAPGAPALRRVVITAGMHARELAPPMAMARFFSQLLVNYVQSRLVPTMQFPLVHPAFFYQAGQHHVMDGENKDITTRQYKSDVDVRRKQALSDASLSPGPEDGVIVDDFYISYRNQALILGGLEIIIMPTCNPGGLDFVLTQVPQEQLSANADTLALRQNWRKNRAPTDTYIIRDKQGNNQGVTNGDPGPLVNDPVGGVDMPAIGVDINRNADFACQYRTYYAPDAYKKKRHGASDNPYDYEAYNGDAPNTEVETLAVMTALHATRATLDGNQGGSPLVLPTNPTNRYQGPLFYLDLHSATQSIYVPWGTDTISNVGYRGSPPDSNQLQTIQNAYFDTRRDGIYKLAWSDRATPRLTGATLDAVADTYQEFFPKNLTFARDPSGRNYDLVSDHLEKFGKPMADAIHRAIVGHVSAENQPRMSRRSEYAVKQSLDLYTVSGSPNDYIFNQNILAADLQQPLLRTSASGVFTNTRRTGPVISLCIEVGHPEDGGFRPIDAQLPVTDTPFRDKSYYSRNQYYKVERETFAALQSFLLCCIGY